MSFLFNKLSRFDTYSSKEQVSFNFMAAVTICSDFGVQESKICHHSHFFPFYLPWCDGTRCHNLSFLNGEFQANVFTLLFHLHQEALTSSPLSAIRVVSSAYLRLLIFLPATLIPAWVSSSLAFHIIYSAYKLNKQGDNAQSWHTPFPNLNQLVIPYKVLTVAYWPAYRFLRRQVR